MIDGVASDEVGVCYCEGCCPGVDAAAACSVGAPTYITCYCTDVVCEGAACDGCRCAAFKVECAAAVCAVVYRCNGVVFEGGVCYFRITEFVCVEAIAVAVVVYGAGAIFFKAAVFYFDAALVCMDYEAVDPGTIAGHRFYSAVTFEGAVFNGCMAV